jgi:hypothetical protein
MATSLLTWREWIRNIRKEAKDVNIEAAYNSFSTLMLLSMLSPCGISYLKTWHIYLLASLPPTIRFDLQEWRVKQNKTPPDVIAGHESLVSPSGTIPSSRTPRLHLNGILLWERSRINESWLEWQQSTS